MFQHIKNFFCKNKNDNKKRRTRIIPYSKEFCVFCIEEILFTEENVKCEYCFSFYHVDCYAHYRFQNSDGCPNCKQTNTLFLTKSNLYIP